LFPTIKISNETGVLKTFHKNYIAPYTFALGIKPYLYMLVFKDYDKSAYHVLISGLKPTGLFVRQPRAPMCEELGNHYLLAFPEIGIDEMFSCENEYTAVKKAKEMIKEKVKLIYNSINATE
jgi:hypothetical protein